MKCRLDFVISESMTWKIIKYFILSLWLCLVVMHASPVAAPDTREVPALLSTCARMDIWGWSEVAIALCGAACTKSRGRPVCSCSHCAPGTGGGIGWALSGKRWSQQPAKRKQGLTFKKVFSSFDFYSHASLLQEVERNHQLLRLRFLKKMIYLADHRPERKSDKYTESILCFYLLCDAITSNAKLVHICWITNLYISAPNLLHSSVCCRLKKPKLVKKWYPSM